MTFYLFADSQIVQIPKRPPVSWKSWNYHPVVLRFLLGSGISRGSLHNTTKNKIPINSTTISL